jgi:hypothetical protein
VIRREVGDRAYIAASLIRLGFIALGQGDLAAARSFFEEGLPIGRELGDQRRIAECLEGLAAVARE